ncbi:MAG: chemotaxis protein CheA [Bacillota bacterium]
MSQNDSLLDIYIYEGLQLLEQLEKLLLSAEKSSRFSPDQIDAIFRILHTIKGSSAMMEYDSLTKVSHSMEDVIGFIREDSLKAYDHPKICDLLLRLGDFLRQQMENLQNSLRPEEPPEELSDSIQSLYRELNPSAPGRSSKRTGAAKPERAERGGRSAKAERYYQAHVFFDADCKMEGIRAFGVQKSLESLCERIETIPEDLLMDQVDSSIIANGLVLYLESSVKPSELKSRIDKNLFVRSSSIDELTDIKGTPLDAPHGSPAPAPLEAAASTSSQRQNYVSVRLDKLDQLMNVVGELVIAEPSVTKNRQVQALQIAEFEQAARALRRITRELQDITLSMRMVPLSNTFQKLDRIVRDMVKKTGKQARLTFSGENTELDKNIIDSLADPLMHMIRNAMDHGIEASEERLARGKPAQGVISLNARNAGSDVLLTISDDGRGLNRQTLIKKGLERGLLNKPESEISDNEAFSLIFIPGFSTKDAITEFSGRGVGLDVVLKNIERVGGSVFINSVWGKGMTIEIRIPLTLSIIGGMRVAVGNESYVIPTLNIHQMFRAQKKDVLFSPDLQEMVLFRGQCFPVVRLHRQYDIDTQINELTEGVLILVQGETDDYCIFADHLIEEQQIVVKPLPSYIAHRMGSLAGISGCTILGDGNISLIVNTAALGH